MAAAFLTRRLGPPVIAHAIFNAVVFAIVLTGAGGDVEVDFGRTEGSAGSVVTELPVVDQPHVTEPGGDQHHAG